MNVPLFSVVIPTYNRKELLGKCLEALVTQSLDVSRFEVIVVDDGSTDGTSDFLKARRFPFRLTGKTEEHGGAPAARNAGIAGACGTYVALTEDDVIPDRDWLNNALKYLGDSSIDVLEGRTIYQHTLKDVRRFEGQRLPSFIPCNLIIKRDVLESVGGYDTTFYDARRHLYFREDADLGFRILDAGYRVAIADDVVVAHPPQFSSLNDCTRHARRYVFDPLLYKKHPLRFRQMIEVKRLFGLIIHRPQHYVALVYLAVLIFLCVGMLSAQKTDLVPLALIAFGCSFVFRYKYQGWRALRLYRIHETLGFLALPVVYLASLALGCFRYKSIGALF
jgi:GT2 family glycosyltransferase